MLTRNLVVRVDAVANIACGALVLVAPRLWRRLDLPAAARCPAAIGMVTGGAGMGCASALGAGENTVALASTLANVAWAGLGVAAVRRAEPRWAKAVLLTIATYDAAMAITKTQTSRPVRVASLRRKPDTCAPPMMLDMVCA